jgi:predicted CoA-binding protein
MSEDACPIPTNPNDSEAQAIRRMLAATRIAVVGLSDDPSRPSCDVARSLRAAGKEIMPVNPNHETVMGLKCYPTLADVPGPIELVNVFRRAEFCADVAREAVAVGARGIWLQSGITSDEARRIAEKAGIDFVENRCLKVELLYRDR